MPDHRKGSRPLTWITDSRYKPRESIWRWDANRLVVLVPILAVMCWLGALTSAWALLSGDEELINGVTRREEAASALAALLAAVILTAWIVIYMRRPLLDTADQPGLTAGTGRFTATRNGYDAAEVDHFWLNIDDRSIEELRRVRFGASRPGYAMDHVDEALDIRIRRYRESRYRATTD